MFVEGPPVEQAMHRFYGGLTYYPDLVTGLAGFWSTAFDVGKVLLVPVTGGLSLAVPNPLKDGPAAAPAAPPAGGGSAAPPPPPPPPPPQYSSMPPVVGQMTSPLMLNAGMPYTPRSIIPSWVVPVGIGVVALGAVYFMTRKKKGR